MFRRTLRSLQEIRRVMGKKFNLEDKKFWEEADVRLPEFDLAKVRENTAKNPVWLHFGAGNIFRGFIAVLQQRLLDSGEADRGIIAAESFDYDIVDDIFNPYDCMTMNVTLNADASINSEIIASITEAVKANLAEETSAKRLFEIFESPSLQMISLTITEKGYGLRGNDGNYLPVIEEDIKVGPDHAKSVMSIVAAGLYKRYMAGKYPVAAVSMDNCSHNGEKLKNAVVELAEAWRNNGLVEEGFLSYLQDESQVSFPWSMIDKITPRPSEKVEEMLEAKGIKNMKAIVTSKNTYIAPFVNAERPQYLVIEDSFPAGRPAFEKAGVFMTDRDTVNKTERMKVTTCLNPLHTAMSVYGCLLGYEYIYEEMKDPEITALITRLGYTEGLPVVTDPKILKPKSFLDEVMQERLPNPFMPDMPQRIATDTSQKVGIRFGETIKSYIETGKDVSQLVAIPLAIAGWFRYLLAVDDTGKTMDVSPDPLKAQLQEKLKDIEWNRPESYRGQLADILKDASIFGLDLTATELGARIEKYFVEELAGQGAVRATLKKHLEN